MKKRNSILIWYLATFLFTGVLILPHILWQEASNYSISFTQLGPLFATLLLIKINGDKDALSSIKKGLRFEKRSIPLYILSAAIPLILTGISAAILTLFFDSKYQAWSGTPIFFLLNFIAMLLGSVGEEIGWRGYLLPSLNKKTSPFISSIIIGLLWGFWHINYANNIVFWLLFVVITIELSILFTFLLNKTKGNLWTSVIFHTFFNLSCRVFVWERFISIDFLIILIIVSSLACFVVIILDNKQARIHQS